MRIWLATVGEPLPMDGENVRLLRTGQFAQWLSERGHDVVFWTGTMDHYGRRLRAAGSQMVRVNDRYRIGLLEGRLYKRSISYARFMNHRDVAAAFRTEAPKEPAPDVIMTSFPTVELCDAVADYASPRGIPYVVDARDFWPDIFVELLPRPLRFAAPLAFHLPERGTRRVFRRASAVAGMTESALQWALAKAGRERNAHDFWHPFPYVRENAPDDVEPLQFPDPAALEAPADHLRICFLGTHSHRVNLEMFVEAFRVLQQRSVPATLFLCGKGPVTEALQKQALGVANVRFPGWLNTRQILSVMASSHVGLLPYNTPDFFMNTPNKVAEYLSAGLPLLSCTDGEVRRLIERERCGFWCEPSVPAIADTVARLAASPVEIAAAAQGAEDVYNRIFDRDSVFDMVLGKLEQLAKSAAEPSSLQGA